MSQEKEKNEDKFVDFEFNKIIRNKPQNKQVVKETNEEIEDEVIEKKVEVRKTKEKNVLVTYKYGNIVFKNLNDLQSFLFLNYYNIEKHATKLLNDAEFIKWLKRNSSDDKNYTEWVNKIL